MKIVRLASLVLAAAINALVPLSAQAASITRDSVDKTLLTAEQMAHYIEVKKALNPYLASHPALVESARSTAHDEVIEAEGKQVQFAVFDYPNLVKQDTALAAIFTKNAFAPSQFESTQVAAFTALLALVENEVAGIALPGASTVSGKNVELVEAYRQELAAVGIALEAVSNMDGDPAP